MATYYVNTASTAGGDGTTNGTVGATRAFASLAEWEASGPRNLTGTGPEIVICEGSTADTVEVDNNGNVNITGWTTTASDYIEIRVEQANRHNGKWNTSKYRLETVLSGFTFTKWCIRNQTAFLRLIGLQLRHSSTDAGDRPGRGFEQTSSVPSGGDVRITACISECDYLSATGTQSSYGFVTDCAAGGNSTVTNCLSYYKGSLTGHSISCFVMGSGGTHTHYNCTAVNATTGFWRAGGTVNLTNCGASGCTTAFDSVSSNTTGSSTTPTFVDAGNYNFHLAAGDTAWKNAGTDLSGTFTTDIDGETRPTGASTWDIGADEVAAVAAILTGTPVAVTWAAGINPAGQSITIPSDATAVYMFWHIGGFNIGNGAGLASATLAGSAPNQTHGLPILAGVDEATGVAIWYNTSTGSQTLDVEWTSSPSEGPTCIVAFVKGGDTTAYRDADSSSETGTNANSVTIITVSGDLVIKFDSKDDVAVIPALTSGWTNGQTQTNNTDASRLSYIRATGTTQVCDSENENYSQITAISIPATAISGLGARTSKRQYLLARLGSYG